MEVMPIPLTYGWLNPTPSSTTLQDELTRREGHGHLAMLGVGMADHIVQRFEHHQIGPLLNCRR